MLAILTIAGLAGFLTSALFLSLGLTDISVRYAIAALAGYVTFLGGIKIWLACQRAQRKRRGFDAGDLPAPDAYPTASDDFSFGGGGGYSGAGAEGEFGAPTVDAPDAAAFDVVPDVDEGLGVLVPILVVVSLLIGLVGAVAVLTGAPGLLAEVLLDGLIAGTAYGRLRDRDRRHWLDGVLRRTWKPMLAVTAMLVLIGAAIGVAEPGADSIGDILRP